MHTEICDLASENQPSGISRNTDLKYSVTKTRPKPCIVLTCRAAKYLVIYWFLL